LTIAGSCLAYFLYAFELNSFFFLKQKPSFKYLYSFINKKWYFDRFYNEMISQNVLNLSYAFSYKDIDRGLLEKVGPSGIVEIIYFFFNKLKVLQSGFIYHYLFLMFTAILFFVLLLVFPLSSALFFNIVFFFFFFLFYYYFFFIGFINVVFKFEDSRVF